MPTLSFQGSFVLVHEGFLIFCIQPGIIDMLFFLYRSKHRMSCTTFSTGGRWDMQCFMASAFILSPFALLYIEAFSCKCVKNYPKVWDCKTLYHLGYLKRVTYYRHNFKCHFKHCNERTIPLQGPIDIHYCYSTHCIHYDSVSLPKINMIQQQKNRDGCPFLLHRASLCSAWCGQWVPAVMIRAESSSMLW